MLWQYYQAVVQNFFSTHEALIMLFLNLLIFNAQDIKILTYIKELLIHDFKSKPANWSG